MGMKVEQKSSMTKKIENNNLKSAAALVVETGNISLLSPAARMQLVHELMNVQILDKNGNPILKKDGTPKTRQLITKSQARKLLGFG